MPGAPIPAQGTTIPKPPLRGSPGGEVDPNYFTQKKPNYWKTVAALAPMSVAKGIIDVPEGMLDKYVEHGVTTGAFKGLPQRELWKRGLGRGLSHMPIAALTAPMFMSGMSDLKSQDSEQRRKGYAKLMASGGILGGGKALTEGVVESVKGRSLSGMGTALKGAAGRMGLARMGLGIGGSLLIARGVVKGDKERDKNQKGLTKYVAPTLAGAVAGAGKGGIEGAMRYGLKPSLSSLSGFRKGILGPAAGRAAAGAIGGAVLGELFHKFKHKLQPADTTAKHDMQPAQQPVQVHKTASDDSYSKHAVGEKLAIPGMKPALELFPHQRRALERLVANKGSLVIAHGVGGGKTATSIAGQKLLNGLGHSKSALVLMPTALRANYAKNLQQYLVDPSFEVIGGLGDKTGTPYTEVQPGKEFYVMGYELFVRHPEIVQKLSPDTLILDEYHRVRNPGGSTYRTLMSVRPNVKNFIGMTGSVVNNDPSDVAPLVSLAMGRHIMNSAQFKRVFERKVAKERGFFGGKKYVIGMKNIPQLQQTFGPYVDYISSDQVAGDKMPKKKVDIIKTPMSRQQEELYNFALNRINPITAWKIRHNVGLSDSEMQTVFKRLILARQASNSISAINPNVTDEQSAQETPKVKRMLDDAVQHLRTTPDGQVVMYSNLVHGGVDVLSAGLKARGIPYGIFVGKDREVGDLKSSEQYRQDAVNQFKKGKQKVLVLSGAGAEGLDLTNTTLLQMLDGHFNPERILQAEARGRRLGGLSHRTPERRQVEVKRYMSSVDRDFWDRALKKKETSVDEWVYNVAGRKSQLNRQFLKAMDTAPQPARPPLTRILEVAKQRMLSRGTSPQMQTGAPVQPQTTQKTDAQLGQANPEPLPPATQPAAGTQQASQTKAPALPRGVELPKDFRKKYLHRYRTNNGEISYTYGGSPGS
jgi:superfamily II DNA or RNA helicase